MVIPYLVPLNRKLCGMIAEQNNQLVLYSYWRSSAAFRVRIALNLKGLPFKTIAVNLVRQGGEQLGEDYRRINPQGLVPVLSHQDRVLTQSMAICEYLDEVFPRYRLLPPEPEARTLVRALALQIACEIHPVNNLRVQKYLAGQCGNSIDTAEWMDHWMTEGFSAIEKQLQNSLGADSIFISGRPGLFECFLIPQVYNAERFGVDMSKFKVIRNIVSQCGALPAFHDAVPENQPDAVPV